MSYTSLLVETCTVRRFTEGSAGNYGNKALTWADHLTDEPCRLVASSGKEIKVGAEIVVADYELFLGNVDITERDKVIVNSITYEVLLVSNYVDGTAAHHTQCLLRISR